MIDISNGRYWDLPWSLVESCTRCSPGCDHCWALAIEKRFKKGYEGQVFEHPERLSIPLKRRKPTVYAVWNDLYHEAVPGSFLVEAYKTMIQAKQHTFLILTKRADVMAYSLSPENCFARPDFSNIYHGLTVVNQAEADAKIPVFLQVPGKKFLSLEPLLGPVELDVKSVQIEHEENEGYGVPMIRGIDAVILGGETGPGARPLHPEWVRSVRDQCAAAGVPFFFKQWGEWVHYTQYSFGTGCPELSSVKVENELYRVGRKFSGRHLDGRTHDDIPWVQHDPAEA